MRALQQKSLKVKQPGPDPRPSVLLGGSPWQVAVLQHAFQITKGFLSESQHSHRSWMQTRHRKHFLLLELLLFAFASSHLPSLAGVCWQGGVFSPVMDVHEQELACFVELWTCSKHAFWRSEWLIDWKVIAEFQNGSLQKPTLSLFEVFILYFLSLQN